MNGALSADAVLENLRLVADWLRVKAPRKSFEIVIVGGGAMALLGMRGTTFDVDVFEPSTLPPELAEAAQVVAKAKGLGREWLNTGAARAVRTFGRRKRLPDYFSERAQALDVAPNLRVAVIGRQALISLKLLAATPSARKHVDDLRALRPSNTELATAKRFVLACDGSEPRAQDLELVLNAVRSSDE